MDHTYSTVTGNMGLENFMREFGILMPTPFEELQEANSLDERDLHLAKDWYRSPYDENGELLF